MFSYKAKQAGPYVGLSWRLDVPTKTDQIGVTADLEAKYGDIQTFFDSTADASGGPNTDATKEATVYAALAVRNLYDRPGDIDVYTRCITFWVS